MIGDVGGDGDRLKVEVVTVSGLVGSGKTIERCKGDGLRYCAFFVLEVGRREGIECGLGLGGIVFERKGWGCGCVCVNWF